MSSLVMCTSSEKLLRSLNQKELHGRGMGNMRSAHNILVRKPEAKRPLGGRRRGREDNIKIDLKEIG
jgi:hypothetical protein